MELDLTASDGDCQAVDKVEARVGEHPGRASRAGEVAGAIGSGRIRVEVHTRRLDGGLTFRGAYLLSFRELGSPGKERSVLWLRGLAVQARLVALLLQALASALGGLRDGLREESGCNARSGLGSCTPSRAPGGGLLPQ